MRLLWKTKLDNQPRQMHSLLEPLVIGRVNTKSGPKEMVIQAGVSDNVYALDAKTGEMMWKRHFESAYKERPARGPSVLCPGGMTANVTIGPGEGAGNYVVYAASWDGSLHKLNAADGEPLAPAGEVHAVQRQAVRAEPGEQRDLHAHRRRVAAAIRTWRTRYDLATNKVGSWGPAGGGMWGRSGPAVSKDLVMYTGTGRRPLGPGERAVRERHHRREAEPEDQGAGTGGLLRAVERRVAGEARPRHAGDARDFRLQGQGVHDRRQQGVPHLPDGHGVDRRRRPSHAGVPDAADLQRDGGFRGGGHLGVAGDLGRRRDALDPDAVLGAEALEVQSADRERRGEEGRDRGVQDGDGRRAR